MYCGVFLSCVCPTGARRERAQDRAQETGAATAQSTEFETDAANRLDLRRVGVVAEFAAQIAHVNIERVQGDFAKAEATAAQKAAKVSQAAAAAVKSIKGPALIFLKSSWLVLKMKLRSIRATTEGTIKTTDLFSEYQLEPYFDADSPLISAHAGKWSVLTTS